MSTHYRAIVEDLAYMYAQDMKDLAEGEEVTDDWDKVDCDCCREALSGGDGKHMWCTRCAQQAEAELVDEMPICSACVIAAAQEVHEDPRVPLPILMSCHCEATLPIVPQEHAWIGNWLTRAKEEPS